MNHRQLIGTACITSGLLPSTFFHRLMEKTQWLRLDSEFRLVPACCFNREPCFSNAMPSVTVLTGTSLKPLTSTLHKQTDRQTR